MSAGNILYFEQKVDVTLEMRRFNTGKQARALRVRRANSRSEGSGSPGVNVG